MRFAFATVALFAASASASILFRRQQDAFPPCAEKCIESADFSDCPPVDSQIDDACVCNSAAFINSVVTCVEKMCKGDDLTKAEKAGEQLCLDAGVTLTNLPTGSATASSPAASGKIR